MSGQYVHLRTAGEERRRDARITRRRAAGHLPRVVPQKLRAERRSYSLAGWQAMRRAARDSFRDAARASIDKLMLAMFARRDAAAVRAASQLRCEHVRMVERKGVDVATDPCGGALKSYRRYFGEQAVLRCQKCGRDWRRGEGGRLERTAA